MEPISDAADTSPIVPWHRSWILRAMSTVALVMLLGYGLSVWTALSGIESASRLAHDPEIEASLEQHLQALKDTHTARQDLVLARIEALLVENGWHASSVTDHQVGRLMTDPAILEAIGATSIAEHGAAPSPLAHWTSRDELQIGAYRIKLREHAVEEQYRRAEGVLQRYQIVGASLENTIIPSLLRSNLLIFAAMLLLTIGVTTYLMHRFKGQVTSIVEGFYRWSENDFSFRFGMHWSGELGAITRQFNRMAQDVESNRRRTIILEKVASWQTMARKLAHEIKNPLTPIQMMVSQLGRRYDGHDQDFAKLLRDAQAIITDEVSALRRMVDHFSDFAKLPTPQKSPTDLCALISHATALQRAATPQHSLVWSEPPKACTLDLDANLIRQVLKNLLKNAAESLGAQSGQIHVRLHESPDTVRVEVEDSGPGIPESLQAKIFEAYFTTKHTGPEPGMGLGLAVCQKIVLDHNGDLFVRSRPGQTIFVMELPKRPRSRRTQS